ncbi:leucine-rich repeat protein (LRRP, pseudogene),putative [Trypanosoma brucei gambiense DAL972]|uniref:leucine-rich repeat protein (LRRP, pseudogene),putative n=1 Tax=Trypanosoma brucei gambiense (strain MHOM/CI/86/DAL972) TaxID=679716 RepID=UPI0001B9D2D2|nr:leucine-rich repeat protein (LRRP, pseudogene),putative [Trypanosoma brucei gambiense DAL972]CBH13057.1 leucine-rich repeat protein (LRRP, pseudogene),putative [Trypanosoma brucei gambiense DAL972]|eukprot:XP_011775334.1 leucine-rich repeat protein (LRRP, pseudogene),putative [Trypanosoma brucei gambiense DAL972]
MQEINKFYHGSVERAMETLSVVGECLLMIMLVGYSAFVNGKIISFSRGKKRRLTITTTEVGENQRDPRMEAADAPQNKNKTEPGEVELPVRRKQSENGARTEREMTKRPNHEATTPNQTILPLAGKCSHRAGCGRGMTPHSWGWCGHVLNSWVS